MENENFEFVLGLRLTIEGEAEAKWTESSGSSKIETTFSGEEKFIDKNMFLFGSKDSDNNVTIAIGVHSYNFVCQLPSNLPYSIDGKYGHVRYRVKANLDIPWAFDLQNEKIFTIARRDEVSSLIEANMPVEFEEIKTFCCWCCKSDPLLLKLRIPRIGFCVGEKIPVSLEIANKSSKDVENTVFELKKIEKFLSKDPIAKLKETKETIVEVVSRGIKKGENVKFDEFIEVPITSHISNYKFCNVYQISYEIKFTANTEGLSVSPHIIVPVTIGSS